MITSALLALALIQDPSAPVVTQAEAPAVAAPFDVQVLPGSVAAPDCGGRPAMAALAFCVRIPSAADGVGAAYVRDLEAKGWLAAGAEGARMVLVRRRPQGGCDGLQMLGLPGPDGEADSGYLAFGAVPADVCVRPPAPTPGLPAPGGRP